MPQKKTWEEKFDEKFVITKYVRFGTYKTVYSGKDTHEEIKSFIRQEIQEAEEIGRMFAFKNRPMGVSEWRNHGKYFGYWEYFEKECEERGAKRLEEEIVEDVKKMNGFGKNGTDKVWVGNGPDCKNVDREEVLSIIRKK